MFYPPSEDTYLLEDALKSSIEENVSCIVEVGSGSGYISQLLHTLYPLSHIISTDINPYAAEETYRVCDRRNTTVIRSSIIEGIRAKIGMAIFNPPYLPSEEKYLEGAWIDRSWAGGHNGMEITDKFLSETAHIPVRYIVLCQYNHPASVIDRLKPEYRVRVVNHQKVLNEFLYILRIERISR